MDLIVSPAVVALNPQSGAPKQALTPGQLIDALVLELIDATTARLAIADSVVDVRTDVPLQPGAHVRLAARGHGDDIRWVIVGTGGSLTPLSKGDGAGQRSSISAPAHPALPATEVTIGAGAPSTDADVAVSSQVRPDLTQQLTKPTPAAQNPAAEFALATRSAAARQNGLAPVLAELQTLVASPNVPAALRRAASDVLAAPVRLEHASAENLRQAISRSGVFLEARMAENRAALPAVTAGDLKSALLTLRQVLQGWIDTLPAVLPPSVKGELAATLPAHQLLGQNVPAPPYRGAPTVGQPPVMAQPTESVPLPELARSLAAHTDGAIARQVLLQVASLPDAGHAAAAHADMAETHWNLEIPFVTPQGAAVAHFEIARDARKTPAREALEPAWRANFSLDFEPMGPVHAHIALTGKRAAVRIWAERSDTAEALRGGTAELTEALRAASLNASDVVVCEGAPPRPLKSNPGRFLDRAS